ncbi:MAG: hypothetical protein MJ016_02420 [Victivallaceae bacterium]|nr:hypothetical protein [Victivallaceae bacterium]
MAQVNVSTKKELAKALKEQQPENSIADEKLAKKSKALAGIKKIAKKTVITICAIGAVAGGVATAATLASSGTAGPIAYPLAMKFTLVGGGAAASGLSTAAIIALVTLGASFSLSAIALLKNYDVSWDVSAGHSRLLLKKKIEKDTYLA